MKKFQALFILLTLALSSSAIAGQSILCQKDLTRVRLDLRQEGGARLRVVSAGGNNSLDVDLSSDAFSPKAKNDLLTNRDLAAVQSHHNSVIVFSMPKGLAGNSLPTSFEANLEFRDYDDDYDKTEYRFEDRGPGANGYVLQSGSTINMVCSSSFN